MDVTLDGEPLTSAEIKAILRTYIPKIADANPYNLPMKTAPLIRHQAAWAAAADLLTRERIQQLQAMTDEDTKRAVARLFSVAVSASMTQTGEVSSCGLAEQQRLFRQLARRPA